MTQGMIKKSSTEVALLRFMFHVNDYLSFVAQDILQYNYTSCIRHLMHR